MRIKYYPVSIFLLALALASSCSDRIDNIETPVNSNITVSSSTRSTSQSVMQVIQWLLSSYYNYNQTINSETRLLEDLEMDELVYTSFLNDLCEELDIDFINHERFETIGELKTFIENIIAPHYVFKVYNFTLGEELIPVSISYGARYTYKDQNCSMLRTVEMDGQPQLTVNGGGLSSYIHDDIESIELFIDSSNASIYDITEIKWSSVLRLKYYYNNGNSTYSLYDFSARHETTVFSFDVTSGPTLSGTYLHPQLDNPYATVYSTVINTLETVFNTTSFDSNTIIRSFFNPSETDIEKLFLLLNERLHTFIPLSIYSELVSVSDLITSCENYHALLPASNYLDPDDVLEAIYEAVSNEADIEENEICLSDSFISLGLDSVNILNIMYDLMITFDIVIPTEHISAFYEPGIDLNELYLFMISLPV